MRKLPIRRLTPQELRHDAQIAALTFAVALALIALGLTGLWGGAGFASLASDVERWWHVAPVLIASVAVVFKRAAPVPALLVGAGMFGWDLALGGSVAMLLPLFDLLYSAALYSGARTRRVLWGVGAVLVIVPTTAQLVDSGNLQWTVLTALQQAALFLSPLWWANDVRRKSELAETAAARADAVERLAEADRQQAVRAERDALARDLHDVVASHLSAIALHSGGALATPAEEGKDRAALTLVRRSALESMEDMRAMISLLRAPSGSVEDANDDGASSLPRLSHLDALVQTARFNGSTVVVTDERRDMRLPDAVDLAGYRIVQEALTNAVKYAPGSDVSVTVRDGDDSVVVEVSNLLAPGPLPTVPGMGLGLSTMEERARAVGGSLSVQAEDGYWTVRLVLPVSVLSGVGLDRPLGVGL
ncbi:histidine kinase [Arthrobacter tecti]